jgi:four helix bundle protein
VDKEAAMSQRKILYGSPGKKGERGFEDLECYQFALEVMARIDTFSKTLPPHEKLDLYSQIRRSSKSVTGNIAEAYGRYHYLDSLRYYAKARGELNETLAHLINARVLLYLRQEEFDELYMLIREAEQALNELMTAVRRQRSGIQEYGDKSFREDQDAYEVAQAVEDEDQ